MSDAVDIQYLKKAVEEALKQRGKANIILAGAPGVGKSTLINAVFHGNLALTGDGRPVTPGVRAISKEDIPLTIIDTRGVTRENFQKDFQDLEDFIRTKQNDKDPFERIHVAWICILEGSRRVEEADSKLAAMFDRYGIPVVGVVTKAMSDQGFKDIVQNLIPEARNVVRVRALPIELDEGYTLPAMGLKTLVDHTIELIPETVKNAFAAAQKASIDLKLKRSHIAVASFAAAATTVGATPIPFADAAALVPTQLTMLATISVIWGIPVSHMFLGTLLSGTLTTTVGTIGGRALASGLLKMIPGVGSVVGGIINAGVAGTLTTAFGEAYIATLYRLTKDNPDREIKPEDIRKEFIEQLKHSP